LIYLVLVAVDLAGVFFNIRMLRTCLKHKKEERIPSKKQNVSDLASDLSSENSCYGCCRIVEWI